MRDKPSVTSSCSSIIGQMARIHEWILQFANQLFMLRDLFPLALHPLDNRGNAHADAHGDEGVFLVGPL